MTRAWGRKGEIAAVSYSSGPERFEGIGEVRLFDAAGGSREAEIESVWQHRGLLIFKFKGADSISDAEALEGCEIRIPFEQRTELPEGEYFQSDLVGCEMIDRKTGEKIGVVRGWKEYGGPALLEVARETGGEPMLVPFAKSICVEIDVAAKRIAVDLPEGLREL